MSIDRYSIVTIVFFFISTFFVIQPVSWRIPRTKIRMGLGLNSAPILTIAILWAAQCLGPTQIRNGIVGTDNIKPYNILILFISLAYMAITLDATGILQSAAFWVSNKGGSNGRKLYFYFYLLLTVISMIIGNDPVILSGTVFLVYYTTAVDLKPDAWFISEFAAANTASMVLFVGNPTNVVITEGFRINNAAFTAYTILPFLACSLVCYLALAIQFRGQHHVPKKLMHTGTLDPKSVLTDPVSAIFGSIWLAICLVVVIVLSFFHVDVWIIVLPFAGGKLIFDIVWDWYGCRSGRLDPNRNVESAADRVKDLMQRQMSRGMSGDQDPETLARQPTRQLTLASAGEAIISAPNGHASPVANGSALLPPGKTSTGHQDSATSNSPTLVNTEFHALKRTDSPLQEGSTTPCLSKDQTPEVPEKLSPRQVMLAKIEAWRKPRWAKFSAHFPIIAAALPRLPFGLIPFAFAQFILIEALQSQGWIEVFSRWLVIITKGQMIPVVWIIGVFGVILCNVAGTNIGATILLTKIVRHSQFPDHINIAAAVALAVASNIGAVSFTFSASLAGLLWESILEDKRKAMSQKDFAKWNALPLLFMTGAGLAVVTAMMVVLY